MVSLRADGVIAIPCPVGSGSLSGRSVRAPSLSMLRVDALAWARRHGMDDVDVRPSPSATWSSTVSNQPLDQRRTPGRAAR
jgi:hypothetical protein